MQTQRRSWKTPQRYNVVSFVVSACFIIVFGIGLVGVTSRANMEGAHARTIVACSQADRIHTVIRNETLASIAAYYGLGERSIVAYNHLGGPNSIYINQSICIPSIPIEDMSSAIHTHKLLRKLAAPMALVRKTAHMDLEERDQPAAPEFQAVPSPESDLPISSIVPRRARGGLAVLAPFSMAVSFRNAYPTGQCTWWAAERYYQLHDVFVPWMNANAGGWVDRAQQFGWHVSSIPTVGSIIVLQGGVQGSSLVGHVAVVEQVLNNQAVIASSMNWGNNPNAVTNTVFYTGTGVAFISQ
ncbi:COG3942 and LysM peptidoglycan-binding domain-containing protein [Dictyobacter formicarum]|uniref:COG3942 and LysM peptidoglycan-binding domain-containing protein n=1 Tax=Dictyobacter formicarum TaxID=2778368 RepID=UPI001915DA62|nr:LysM domain-containing protein [Dictyobacter formicarum]